MGPRLLGRGNQLSARLDARLSVPSMGPRLLGRGNPSSFCMSRIAPPLQWGRVCWDAEMKDGTTECDGQNSLQWGRVCWDAEIAGSFTGSFVPDAPSMGPRLLGRGNELGPELGQDIRFILQWGRVCWDAEITPCAASLANTPLLQWGRVCWDAEMSRVSGLRHGRATFNGAASVGTRKFA